MQPTVILPLPWPAVVLLARPSSAQDGRGARRTALLNPVYIVSVVRAAPKWPTLARAASLLITCTIKARFGAPYWARANQSNPERRAEPLSELTPASHGRSALERGPIKARRRPALREPNARQRPAPKANPTRRQIGARLRPDCARSPRWFADRESRSASPRRARQTSNHARLLVRATNRLQLRPGGPNRIKCALNLDKQPLSYQLGRSSAIEPWRNAARSASSSRISRAASMDG